MDKVSAEFHKNVLLLTKFVTPHDDFKKQFKEGMFDKPNTLGFIQVSFYLLNVYYKGNIKNKIHWPVICKQTENKFRNDVRECLMVIANEHSDVNFPPIFASHLLLARGTKFIIIMWKLSLVVLRIYLMREHQSIFTTMPKPGPYQEITKKFLRNVANDHYKIISNTRKERENIEKEANDYQRKKSVEQNNLKAEVLKMREDLKNITITAPVNDSARAKLINIEDNEIINMWIRFLDNSIKSVLETDYQTLKEMDEFLKSIGKIVSNLTGNSQILNAFNFEQINIEPVYKLVPPELQVLLYDLYSKKSLNLQNFFTIFYLLLQKFESNFQKKQLDIFRKCNTQLQVSNQDLQTALNQFQNLHKQIETFTLGEIKKSDELNNSHKVLPSIPEYDKVLFMPSPSIQINSYSEASRTNYQNYLKLTPIEGAHKELFSRHAFNNQNEVYTVKKKHLSVQRINFDDSSLYDTSNDKQSVSMQRFHAPSKLRSTFKNVDKYSRIFSTRTPNSSRVNNSAMMMMSSTGSSLLPLMTKQHCISLMDSCNSSQEFSQEPLLLNPNLNSTIEPSKLEEGEKIPQKNKRRSIGDLVERYKRIIQKRGTDSQVINITTSEPVGEETII